MKKKAPPKLFSLSSLQGHCASKYKYTAKQVLDSCQVLYEELKAFTYPRTDCSYLSEGDFPQAQDVISTIKIALSNNKKIHGISPNLETIPRCYNDKKTTAHTAIIPTTTAPDFSLFDKSSRRTSIGSVEVLKTIYEVVAERFLCQFLGNYEYEATTIHIQVDDYHFKTTGNKTINKGWRAIQDNPKDPDQSELPTVLERQTVTVADSSLVSKKTRPPEYFLNGTLPEYLANVTEHIQNEELKQRLGSIGIGTEATRTGCIESVIKVGLVKQEKDTKLVVTELGRNIYPSIPNFFKSPDMTVVWEQSLSSIALQKIPSQTFNENIIRWTENHIQKLLHSPPQIKQSNNQLFQCLQCNNSLRRIKGKFGYFWGCSVPECKTVYADFEKKPLYPLKNDGEKCKKCEKGLLKTKLIKENNKKRIKKKPILACDQYPECKNIILD